MRPLLVGLALLVGLLATTASCAAAPTPLCDAASAQLTAGRVGAAAELSARAKQAEEGSCGDTGLTAASERYAAAYGEVAAGSTAEVAGDPDGAVAHYEAAQRLDVGNPVAIEGLTRLGRQATTVDTPVTVAPAPVTVGGGVAWPWVAGGGVLLALLLAGLGWLGHRHVRRLDGELSELRHRAEASDQGLDRRVTAAESRLEQASPVELADLRERADAARRGLTEVHDYVDALLLGELRMLNLVLDRTRTEQGLPDDGRSRTLLHWPALAEDHDVPEDDTDPDELRILLVVARARPTDDEAQVEVREYHAQADRLDLAALLETSGEQPGVLEALADPRDTDRLVTALDVSAVDEGERRTFDLVGDDPLPAPVAEQELWRALDATVVLVWSRRTAARSRWVDVCTLSSPPAAAMFVETPELVPALRDPGPDRLAVPVRTLVERALVDAVGARDRPRLEPAPPGSLVVVGPEGPSEREIAAAFE